MFSNSNIKRLLLSAYLLSIIFIIVLVSGCKEKLPSDLSEQLPKTDMETLRKVFDQKGYISSINRKFNDSSEISYEPLWKNGFERSKNDSTKNIFIPLTPYLKNSKTNKIIQGGKFLGSADYIIVKVGKTCTYYFGRYITAELNDKPVQLDQFTGSLLIKNLVTNQTSVYPYENGISKNGLKKTNDNLRVTGCYTTSFCTWGASGCDGAIIASTQAQNANCIRPAAAPYLYGMWELTYTETQETCFPEPDPTDPGTGGTGGSGSGTSAAGRFTMSTADQARYPRFTAMIKNLTNVVTSNPNMMAALKIWTGLSDTDIYEHLQFNQGPLLKIEHLDGAYGKFRKNDPNTLIIDKDFVMGLEQAYLESTKRATSFLLSVTVLHEYVHYGDFLSGVEFPGEEGSEFEKMVFGVVVDKYNANDVYVKIYGRPK